MRSPNYPAIGLPEAIDLSRKIWEKEKRTSLNEVQTCQAMGYKSLSGASRVRLSALKKYGLLVPEGNLWKLSERAMNILHKPNITREYKQAIQDAIRGIALFVKLLQTHPDASDATLRSHLIVDHGFTEEGADSFIQSFNLTKSLDVDAIARDNSGVSSGNGETPLPLAVGDVVQWTSQGVAQFSEPREVVGLQDGYAFIKGESCGIPVDQLTVEKQQARSDEIKPPPPNPHFRTPVQESPIFTTDLPRENRVEIRFRKKPSPEEFNRFIKILELSSYGLVDDAVTTEN